MQRGKTVANERMSGRTCLVLQRIPCPGTRVCNSKLKQCESGKTIERMGGGEKRLFVVSAVNPDRVNWFVYDFEIQTELLRDVKFVDTFKR